MMSAAHEASDPGVSRLAHDLRTACMRVSRRVRFETAGTIAPHHFMVLARLQRQSSTVTELAEAERISAPSMSRTVAALVEREWVARSPHPDDGRTVVLTITDLGAELIEAQRVERDAWMAERLEQLTPDERGVLTEATEILERVLSR